MKHKLRISLILLVLTLVFSAGVAAQESDPSRPADSQPSEVVSMLLGFSYQGRLQDYMGPYNGTCDFQFSLFGSYSGSDQIGSTLTTTGGTVTDGFFHVTQLDFGPGAFDGQARYLEVKVRCPAGSGDYTPLIPRQAILATPYALAMPGLYTQPYFATVPNIIGGYHDNAITYGVDGSVISGGGDEGSPNQISESYAAIGGGLANTVDSIYATISGGISNTIGTDSYDSFIGGGGKNTIATGGGNVLVGGWENQIDDGWDSVLGGGFANNLNGSFITLSGGQHNLVYAEGATVSGGITNTIDGSASYSVIGGGGYNHIAGTWANTISGGYGNYIEGDTNTIAGGSWNAILASDNAFIGGGVLNTTYGAFSAITSGVTNTIEITGTYAAIGGGQGNTVSGWAGAIPGGADNTAAGAYSFAAGRNAQANHDGSFVWADSRADIEFQSLRDYQFRVRAAGGVEFQDGDGNWVEFLNNDMINTSTGAYLSSGGAWTNASDVSLKENFSSIDTRAVLQKLAEVPTQSWNYKSESAEVRHIGPMAQDFYAAFGLGNTDKAISTVDADGVALAAIQGLYDITQEQAQTIDELQTINAELEVRLSALESSRSTQSDLNIVLLAVGSLLMAIILTGVLLKIFPDSLKTTPRR